MEYVHKIGIEYSYLDIGEVENIQHYLRHCQNYDVPREEIKPELFLYPTTQKVAGYYVIPSELWVSIRLSFVSVL